jgi:hydrogenase-4 component B
LVRPTKRSNSLKKDGWAKFFIARHFALGGSTFSNAMRTFYSFIYRPTEETKREAKGIHYFVHRLVFSHEVAPIFGPCLFAPITRTVFALADRLKALQSGQLNFYLAPIGILLVLILVLTLY